MGLTRTLDELALDIRRCADIEDRTDRFPTAEVYGYANLGLAALHRKLKQAVPDQQWLATTTFTTTSGVSLYPLGSTFRSLISIDITANGHKQWLLPYMMHERADLTDPEASFTSVPQQYRLRGDNIELLPLPRGAYQVVLWYVPSGPTLTAGSDTFDTIERLDQYVIWWGAREALFKDKHLSEYDRLGVRLKEMEEDIFLLGRSRDLNGSSRVVDVHRADRFGRRRRYR